jgi:hypothetical protein
MFGITAFAQAPFASLAGPTVVVAITGVQASGAVGTVVYVKVTDAAITGVQAAGNAGTVAVGARSFALTGVESSSAVGTIASPSRTVALTGVSGQGIVGTPLYFYWTTIDDGQTPNWINVAMTV